MIIGLSISFIFSGSSFSPGIDEAGSFGFRGGGTLLTSLELLFPPLSSIGSLPVTSPSSLEAIEPSSPYDSQQSTAIHTSPDAAYLCDLLGLVGGSSGFLFDLWLGTGALFAFAITLYSGGIGFCGLFLLFLFLLLFTPLDLAIHVALDPSSKRFVDLEFVQTRDFTLANRTLERVIDQMLRDALVTEGRIAARGLFRLPKQFFANRTGQLCFQRLLISDCRACQCSRPCIDCLLPQPPTVRRLAFQMKVSSGRRLTDRARLGRNHRRLSTSHHWTIPPARAACPPF